MFDGTLEVGGNGALNSTASRRTAYGSGVMLHGTGKQIVVVLFLAGLPIILLSLLFAGVLFGAFCSALPK